MLTAYHNSRLAEYRRPVGAVEQGTEITIRIKLNADACQLIVDQTSFPMERCGAYFSLTFTATNASLSWYYFTFQDQDQRYYYGNNATAQGGAGAIYQTEPLAYQITLYQKNEIPAWFRNGIIYQIYTDRFFRGTDFTRRIMSLTKPKNGPQNMLHLNWDDAPFYLKDEKGHMTHWDFFGGTLLGICEKLDYLEDLGVTILYLNPIFKASSNHKYDTGDYMTIDPAYGDEESFRQLIAEAAKRDMKIILDGVFNHTGCDSKYFNQYGNYPDVGAYQDKNSPYYPWYTFQEHPNRYECWWGVDDLPSVQENNESYLNYILAMMEHWETLGISGWRLDVIDELPLTFLEAVKKQAKARHLILLGEVWEDASHKVTYGEMRNYFQGNLIDSVMNYPFRDQIIKYLTGQISAETVVYAYESLSENYPKESFYALANLLGSHDTERIFSVLGENIKKALYFQICMPGIPYVYYGDEVGLEGGKDPDNRKTYPWGQENESLLRLYREVLNLRKQYSILTEGDFTCSFQGNALLITRSKAEEKITLLINQNGEAIPFEQTATLAVDLETGEIINDEILVQPQGMRVIYEKKIASPLQSKKTGVLLAISSLNGFRQAEEFVDILAENQFDLWQILPLNPLDSYGSPYSSCSAFAYEERYLQPKTVLKNYRAFCSENEFWLDDYCLYKALKNHLHKPWYLWEDALKNRAPDAIASYQARFREEIQTNRSLQYSAYLQWQAVKTYANQKGIQIIGDLPFYVNYDSCDCWVGQRLFDFTAQGGAPPDAYNPDGQNWAVPVFNWREMEKDGFAWWKQRIQKAKIDYDYFRIDHFRGLESYWEIDCHGQGSWKRGPGKRFLDAMYQAFDVLPMIVEDLGFITKEVTRLRNSFCLPTMAVYEFSPNVAAVDENTVLYSSTHDSMPFAGLAADSERLQAILDSKAKWIILPLQDILGLGEAARMNTPGTIEGNWQWNAGDLSLVRERMREFRERGEQIDA